MKRSILLLKFLFSAGMFATYAQLPPPEFRQGYVDPHGGQYISAVRIWHADIEQWKTLELVCITPYGNRADLAAYINLNFRYPFRCVEMYADGRMYIEVVLDAKGGLDSLTLVKKIPGCEGGDFEKQVASTLKLLQKIDATGQTRKFLISVDVTVVLRPPRPMTEILPNW